MSGIFLEQFSDISILTLLLLIVSGRGTKATTPSHRLSSSVRMSDYLWLYIFLWLKITTQNNNVNVLHTTELDA